MSMFSIHWLAVTLWIPKADVLNLWDDFFSPHLGELHPSKMGGRGFRGCLVGLVGAKLYTDPGRTEGQASEEFVHLELPGKACEALPLETMRDFLAFCFNNFKTNITRMDLTWDGVPFRPEMIETAVKENKVRTSAKRDSLRYEIHPLEKNRKGKLGNTLVSLGARGSHRRILNYDRRGPIRLEFQVRHERANAIAGDLVWNPIENWSDKCVAHLRDYVDFIEPDTKELLPWWENFVQQNHPANLKITNAQKIDLEIKEQWLRTQVAPTLSVVADIRGRDAVDSIIEYGRQIRSPKYENLISKFYS